MPPHHLGGSCGTLHGPVGPEVVGRRHRGLTSDPTDPGGTRKNKVTPPLKTRAVLHSGMSDVLQDMWHSCPKVFAIVVSVLPAVRPLPKALIDMAGL